MLVESDVCWFGMRDLGGGGWRRGWDRGKTGIRGKRVGEERGWSKKSGGRRDGKVRLDERGGGERLDRGRREAARREGKGRRCGGRWGSCAWVG